ncbi:MAG: 6-carboxytetrahydropterin synthase [Chloroflexi bacterium]|nr:6-carboxytetrahydropterin synthase [Chloroflexota bacterium]
MFSVGVSDHIMVAHSLRGETFGSAQRLHGATYEVRVEVLAPDLDADGIVVDIGALTTALRETLAPLDYQNLDDLPAFDGQNTTTEFLCRWLHAALAGRLGALPDARLRVTLVETPRAWAAYEGPLG